MYSLQTEEEQTQQTATTPMPEAESEFNGRNCWYPVSFVQDLPKDKPYTFSLYDEPFVLFQNQEGKLGCVSDRCPHRAAKLSDGQILDGKLECLYHGWQFGVDGQCLHIPQLPADAKIPAKACLQSLTVVEHQGIIWVWPGETEAAQIDSIPTVDDLEKAGFISTDVMRDLPYNQNFFIENVTDPAHVNISHHGSQGNRKDALPLEMEIVASSPKGFRGRYRPTGKSNAPWRYMDFIAPNLVLYTYHIEPQGWSGGLALYSIPLSHNQCRVLVRNYRNFQTWKIKLTPRWFDHLFRNRILEEDLQLVVGQSAQISRIGTSLQEIYLPLKTCDNFVLEYRKWLDKVGSSLPFYQGYSTSNNAGIEEGNPQPVLLDRFSSHTQLCASCNQAYQGTSKVKQGAVGVAIALAAWAILIDGAESKFLVVLTALLAVAVAAVAERVKTKLERSYTRH